MRLVTLICLLSLVTFGSALAFAPTAITFQGQVTENGGGNVPDGNHSLTFRVYNIANGGSPLYATTEGVDVQGGIFSVVLPIGLPFDEAYWIGVQYEAEAEMTPRVPFTSAPYAMNVHENAAVTSLNGNTGAVNLIAGANVSIVPSGNNFIIAATGAVTDDDWDVVGTDMTAIPIGNVGIGVPVPETKLQVAGDVTAGTAVQASFFMAHNGTGSSSIFGGDHGGQGGQFQLSQEDGTTYGGMQPDIDGDGGFFWVDNGNFGTAFMVDGDFSGLGSPLITMSGNNSSVVFDLEQTENLAAQLPLSSISAFEMLDEPGLASINDHGNSSYSITDSYEVVTSRSITAPTDGFLLVMCSLEIDLRHEAPGASFVTAGLSLSPNNVDNNQDLTYYLPSTAATGIYLTPSTPTAVYPVSAGNHTVYLNANKSGTSSSFIWDTQLNLVFIPTSYGSVTFAGDIDQGDQETNQSVSRPLSSGDIASEQRASAQANEQRMQRELDQMRADFETLKREVESSRNGDPNTSGR
jgi:hypothetical protein